MTGSRALAGLVAAGALSLAGRRGHHAARSADRLRRRSRAAVQAARARHRRLRRIAYRAGPGAGGRRACRSARSARSTARRASPRPSKGVAGHAGAVPMRLRQDALAASAEMILAIEARARQEPDLVATVGRIDAEPGAINVIPGPRALFHRHPRAARRMAPPRGLRHRRRAAGDRRRAQGRS